MAPDVLYTTEVGKLLKPERLGHTAWHRLLHFFARDNEYHLLNLFTGLLIGSATVIMLVVGLAIYQIYSSTMIKNVETTAISVANLIMSAEEPNILRESLNGTRVLAIGGNDMTRLNTQMLRYLKSFGMTKIKLFTPDREIIYSTDASQIGLMEPTNHDLNQVIMNRVAFAELADDVETFRQSNRWSPFRSSIVEAYSPIFSDQRLVGVFEIYIDITKTQTDIIRVLFLTMATLGGVLGLCLFNLYLPMKRGTLSLITAHNELHELSTRDHLTGAYNRRYITDRARQEFHRMRRHLAIDNVEKTIGFIMADIDHFKSVNDTYGHAVGDEVLREVSYRLKNGLRDYDVLCRYGGEEFLVMLPHTGTESAMMVAERLRQNIIKTPVTVTLDGLDPIQVTVSFGVATSKDGHESELAVIARADAALYLAKNGGRNRVVLSGAQGTGA